MGKKHQFVAKIEMEKKTDKKRWQQKRTEDKIIWNAKIMWALQTVNLKTRKQEKNIYNQTKMLKQRG